MIDDKYYRYAAEQMERASRERKKYNGYKDKPERITGEHHALGKGREPEMEGNL